MINIVESHPNKLSGISSLHISFKYDAQIISIIKQCDKYVYDKSTYQWEVPVTSLAFLLDELTYIDDINLQLQVEDKDVIHYVPTLLKQYKLKPFQHQLEAIEFGLNIDKWLLLDDPGLGKTASIIHLAEELKEQKGLEHCLIICGINTLKLNWEKEIAKHSNLPCRVLGKKITKKGTIKYDTIKERAQELLKATDAFFMITNVETLRSDDIINALKSSKTKYDMIVIDECHKCSNEGSIQGHNILKLKNYKYKIGLTGTLLQNKPLDAHLPLKWIEVDNSNLTNFKSQYCVYGGFGGHQIIGYKNLDILKQEIDSCSLRRTKKELKDFLPKTIIKETVEMDDQHRKFYENVVNGIKEECDKIKLNSNNILALTTRLRQATVAPSMLTTNTIVSSKIERCVELAEEILSNPENKLVIMSFFKEPVYELQKVLKEYNPLIGTGDMKDDIVSVNIDKFQNDTEHRIFIATCSKCGTGITLNRASYMIMLDTPWTDALTRQVEDRIHRIDNKEPAVIYRLICENSIDEVVDKIVETKKAFSDFVIDDQVDEDSLTILREYIQDL